MTYGPGTIAAVFVEPIAGSTGCLVPPKGYLERLREICDKYGILLVFDEVICGFGRLGHPFAAQAFGVTPDIMTLAKALTNGAQPMGAVAVKDEIYETVVEKAAPGMIEFFHGYTYSGHPAACAAGLATMEIYRKEKLFEKAAKLSPYFLDAALEPQGHPPRHRHPGLRPVRRHRREAGQGAWHPGQRAAEEDVLERPAHQMDGRHGLHRPAARRREEPYRRDDHQDPGHPRGRGGLNR